MYTGRMTRYLALLRGINVGGKNKVAMSELRECFEALGFTDVSTYINSGNIFFSSSESSEVKLVKVCEAAIEKKFGFPVVTMVISKKDFVEAMEHAPKWWGGGRVTGVRSDALFVIPPTKTQEVRDALQVKPDAPDKFDEHGQVIFWALPMEKYSKSVVPKIIGTPIYKSVTIRSSTTAYKLLDLLQSGD